MLVAVTLVRRLRRQARRGTVGGVWHGQVMDLAVSDADPRRRIAFGSLEAARRFVAGLAGWSVASSEDPDQPPVTGTWTAPGDAAG